MNKKEDILAFLAVIAFMVLGFFAWKKITHDTAVEKDLRMVITQQYNDGIEHKKNIQKKCGIDDNETMTVAWAKIDACIGEK